MYYDITAIFIDDIIIKYLDKIFFWNFWEMRGKFANFAKIFKTMGDSALKERRFCR